MARPDEIVQRARSRGIRADLFSGLDSVRTVVEASDALERPLGEVGNTVLVTVRGEPALVLVPGDRSVDGGRIGRAFGAKPLEVSLATAEEVHEHTGYSSGMIPPFGHETDLDLLVDEHLLEHETVVVPSGSPHALIEITPKDLAGLDNAEVGDWSVPLSGENAGG